MYAATITQNAVLQRLMKSWAKWVWLTAKDTGIKSSRVSEPTYTNIEFIPTITTSDKF